MSRIVVAASLLLVVAGSWSVSAQPQTTVAPRAVVKSATPRLLPGTRSSVLTIVQGNALDSTNGPMPHTLVRLRDARIGRVVDSQLTDASGMFAFKVFDPGSYIVEMIGSDQTLLAASQILNVNAGEAISAIVKLPFRVPPFAGLLGSSTTSAALIATQAAASGIAAAVPTKPVSPLQ
jgi:hypothetical protein